MAPSDDIREKESPDDSKRPRDDDQAKEDKDKKNDKDAEGKEEKPSPLKKPKVRIAIIVVSIVLLIALIVYVIYYFTRGRYFEKTNDAYIQADQVDVAPRISGYVDEVLVDENKNVTAGQVLVRIASRDYDAKVQKDRAEIAEAQSSELEAQAHIDQQLAQITRSEATLRQSQAQERQSAAAAKFDQVEMDRYRPLADAGAETNEKRDQAATNAEKSAAQLQASREQVAADAAKLEYDRRQVAVYVSERASAQAKVQRGEADMAADTVDLDAATVSSRIAGRVADRTVRVGEYLQAGTRVMTIVPVESLYIKANFKETQIGLMRVGQPATIKVDALDGMEINGTVESFSPGTGAQFSLIPTDNATGNFTKITQRVPVRIRLDAGPLARRVLVPGLSVIVVVNTIGAEDDRDADKQESKADRDQGKRDADQDNKQQREHHDLGAGRE